MILSNWGNYPRIETNFESPRSIHSLTQLVAEKASLIGRGLGRCYGDSALNDENVVSLLHLDKMLSFDADAGVLVAEAGVSLGEIAEAFVPRGWFVSVTPGTRFVTLGGAIASDVHGKNHHISGTFGQHVIWFDLLTAQNGVVRCSPQENEDLFRATCGGQGLTGLIIRAAIKLVRIPSAWIKQRGFKARNLTEIMEAFERYHNDHFSVAWIDCLQQGESLGRSYYMGGDFAKVEDLPLKNLLKPYTVPSPHNLSVPFDLPSCTLNTVTVRAFNALYYGKAPRGESEGLVSYHSFFYPLDAIHNWNRIYGKKGFIQYQFVIPKEAAFEGLSTILKRITASGLGSFLAVLKLFGKQAESSGHFSFPFGGYTLALDFPISEKLFPLLNELDHMVLDYGGRHYLSKDARLSSEIFRRGYGKNVDEFLEIKSRWDKDNIFSSLQAKRLKLVP